MDIQLRHHWCPKIIAQMEQHQFRATNKTLEGCQHSRIKPFDAPLHNFRASLSPSLAGWQSMVFTTLDVVGISWLQKQIKDSAMGKLSVNAWVLVSNILLRTADFELTPGGPTRSQFSGSLCSLSQLSCSQRCLAIRSGFRHQPPTGHLNTFRRLCVHLRRHATWTIL